MIRDHLIPALEHAFSDWKIAFDVPPQPIATFPAAQAAVGRVQIYDEGDEATVVIEKITHSHFNFRDKGVSEAERDTIVTEDVIEFLRDLFSDRVLLHVAWDGRSGGWSRIDLASHEPTKVSPSNEYFLWSRPYQT